MIYFFESLTANTVMNALMSMIFANTSVKPIDYKILGIHSFEQLARTASYLLLSLSFSCTPPLRLEKGSYHVKIHTP